MDIAILIVDDFPLVRRGIVAALQADPGMTVVGEAGSVAEGLEQGHERCGRHAPQRQLDPRAAIGFIHRASMPCRLYKAASDLRMRGEA